MSHAIKRQLDRVLLFVHFVALTLCLGTIFTNVLIERHTRSGSLELLSIGRDLVTLSSHNLIQTGFLVMVFSGILITLLRYGLRAPLWAWLKLGISVIVFSLVIFGLDPASTTATEWARWSAEHGQLAPQFVEYATRAGRFGVSILALLLVTAIVAIWKPTLSRLRAKQERRAAVAQAS